jgi:ATP-dependent RNA helicase RhlE
MNKFNDFVTSPVLRGNLARQAFETPTPIQAQAIPPAIEGRDLIATAQTGTGKTLAFALPVLERLLAAGATRNSKPQALILSPTRELALQIEETFNRIAIHTGLRSVAIVGGMSESKQLHSLRKGAQVIIATPGRLCDFLDRKLAAIDTVRMVVLDEADRMLDMGFLPAVESILRMTSKDRQTLFFSATFEGGIERLAAKHLKDPVRIAAGTVSRPAEGVDLHVYDVEQDSKLSLLNWLLNSEKGTFLVFARTKHGADKLARKVSAAGHKATAIHGDRSQSQRNAALKGFQDGTYRVLVATDVASRGIHVDGIAHVVNYDLPQAADDFVHRVGRTGRAGAQGRASTFASASQRNEIRSIERTLKVRMTYKEVPEGLPREERRGAAVIEMPKPQSRAAALASRSQSFRPRRRRFGR